MTRSRQITFAIAALLLAATAAQASWYDDYDAGVAAARRGQWSVVVQKMNAAIKGNANENAKARTYGAVFINYRPYYYRGIAHLNSGNYEAAVNDLERTGGPGELDLGPIGDNLARAKQRLGEANTPEPQPQPQPQPQPTRPAPVPVPAPVTPVPVPITPTGPVIDPALRQRAASAISSARGKLTAAQSRKATASDSYRQALATMTEANTRNGSARSNDDLNAVIAMAENAGLLADSAVAPGVAAAPAPVLAPVPKPVSAANAVLGDYSAQLRSALENYFAGEFEASTRDFQDLSRKLPQNAWIWAFLGASQYSQYAFEADEKYRSAAVESFKKAKTFGKFRNGLPERYFSRRIRRVFNELG
jgi:tetratricopeptide (TPR) repeat protein